MLNYPNAHFLIRCCFYAFLRRITANPKNTSLFVYAFCFHLCLCVFLYTAFAIMPQWQSYYIYAMLPAYSIFIASVGVINASFLSYIYNVEGSRDVTNDGARYRLSCFARYVTAPSFDTISQELLCINIFSEE